MSTGDYHRNQRSSVEPQRELRPPHFDERAVATAHPVEPLPLPPRRSTNLKRRVLMGAAAVAYLSVVVTTLFVMASSHVPIAGETPEANAQVPTANVQAAASPNEIPTADVQAVASPGNTQSVAPASPQTPRPIHVGTRVRVRHAQIRTTAVEEQNKPVARRVGVLRYGRSRSTDQP